MTATLVNPPPTPIRGTRLVEFNPPSPTDIPNAVAPPVEQPAAAPRFHAEHCQVCGAWADSPYEAKSAESFVDAVVGDAPTQAVPRLYGPALTPGQARVFDKDLARLIRMLDARTPAADAAVLVLLEDMAGQAPELDATIARRREVTADRRTVALPGLLSRRGGAL